MDGRVALDRDAIVAATDLSAMADSLLGPRIAGATSPRWPCPEPDHDPTAPVPPHLSLFTTRRGEQRWHCPNCGADGSAVDLVMKAKRIGYRDALEHLANRVGIETTTGAGADPPSESGVPFVQSEPRGGLGAWVQHCSQMLWQPYGEPTRGWLTDRRGLPENILRFHRIGATGITPQDDLPVEHAVEGSRSASPAAVLPVVARGRAIYAQLRLIEPDDDQSPYINAHRPQGRHPRIGLYRPPRRVHSEIIVTEGIIDALAANAGGYRAAAVLAPGLADAEIALHLARLNGPLVLAFDPDEAGSLASDRLAEHLWAHGRRPALLAELEQDLGDSLVAANDWPRKLAMHVRHAVASGPADHPPAPEAAGL
jgi:hypothetical protein